MNPFRHLFGRSEARAAASARPVGQTIGIGLFPTAYGGFVSAHEAESLNAVTAAVNAIASAIGTLVPRIYQTVDGVRSEAPRHPLSPLLRTPNPAQSWSDFAEMMMGQVLLHGNALAEIVADSSGLITAFNPIPWRCVRVSLLPSEALAYDITPPHGIGPQRRLLASEVIHLKDRSDDGLVGRSRLSRAPGAVRTGLFETDFTQALWRNGGQIQGTIEVPTNLSEAAFERFKMQLRQEFTGVHNAGKTIILEQGAKFAGTGISPEDAQVLQSRKFTVEEVCRLFQVPPPLLQEYSNSTFTNSAQASIWFAQNTLAPWVRKVEAEFTRSVFGRASDYELDLDLSTLMRGDFATRWDAWDIAVRDQILTPDEVREAEGYAPRGDAPPAPARGGPNV
jgi:HK97 family phage portal protein